MDINMDVIVFSLLTVISAATPLIFAGIGELIAEKSGVLNLGVEGMMLMGAVMGFITVNQTDSAILACLVASLAGATMALIFAFLTLSLHANQVATGLALTIFGVGLSALLGQSVVGVAYAGLPTLAIPLLSDIPVLGRLLFNHNALIYLSFIIIPSVMWFLRRTRSGLILRAVGESHEAAHSIGYSVVKIRYLATLFGGAMAGLGGAFISLSYSPMWAEGMTAGRGWIALALVVFATWLPMRLMLGAYMFGGITILQLHAQASGMGVPSELLSMLPYLATILVLVIISRGNSHSTPACLGKPFHPAS